MPVEQIDFVILALFRLLYIFFRRNQKTMNKGKFTIKNHKKLVIERQIRDLQDKKHLQVTKSAVKMNLVVFDENSAPLGHKKLHSKQEGCFGHQNKRRTTFSYEKLVNQNASKHAQSPKRHEIFVRQQSKRMKSCYIGPQIQNGQPSHNSLSEIKQKSLKTQILVKSLYQLLRSNEWISQGKADCFSMKYEHFSSFLLHIMNVLSLKRQTIQNKILRGFNSIIDDLKKSLAQQEGSTGRNGLRIDSNLASYQYSSQKFKKEYDELLIKISKLTKDRENLANSVTKLRSAQDALTVQYDLKQDKLTCISKELQNLSLNKEKTEEEYALISESLILAQDLYSSIAEKEKSILDYVMKQQNNKIIRLVSEDYKLIEADIYQYASYLQSNELATNLDYQPRPFDFIERELMEEMKEVNRFIIREQVSSMAEKTKAMRDFILKVVDKFKKKDQQIGKLCDFKTKCIKKFVNQMKKWLNNWQLKQEYLVNLRKGFVLDSSALKKKLDGLFSNQSYVSCPPGRDMNERGEIMALFNKIQENYKLGNSFY